MMKLNLEARLVALRQRRGRFEIDEEVLFHGEIRARLADQRVVARDALRGEAVARKRRGRSKFYAGFALFVGDDAGVPIRRFHEALARSGGRSAIGLFAGLAERSEPALAARRFRRLASGQAPESNRVHVAISLNRGLLFFRAQE